MYDQVVTGLVRLVFSMVLDAPVIVLVSFIVLHSRADIEKYFL